MRAVWLLGLLGCAGVPQGVYKLKQTPTGTCGSRLPETTTLEISQDGVVRMYGSSATAAVLEEPSGDSPNLLFEIEWDVYQGFWVTAHARYALRGDDDLEGTAFYRIVSNPECEHTIVSTD